MSAVDNSKWIAEFCQDDDDGDTFIYTEMLDRTVKKGNNNHRLVKTFYHRSKEEFWSQLPTIQELCNMTKARAYTRLAPRSFEKVGKAFTQLVVEAAMQGNWNHMKALYNSACGRTPPTKKLWLFDVDKMDDKTEEFAKLLMEAGVLRARIPSRKGEHLITVPFDPRPYVDAEFLMADHPSVQPGWQRWGEVSLHKDNPTNLYIPEGAA